MNGHEIIDRIDAKPTKTKIIAVIAGFVGLVLLVLGLMYGGYLIFRQYADSDYQRESEERGKRIAILENNEKQLAAENELLKKQNEAMAESLVQADTERERRALADLARREAERAEKFAEIDADTNFDSQICATCREYAARGFRLSFCGRCEGQ